MKLSFTAEEGMFISFELGVFLASLHKLYLIRTDVTTTFPSWSTPSTNFR